MKKKYKVCAILFVTVLIVNIVFSLPVKAADEENVSTIVREETIYSDTFIDASLKKKLPESILPRSGAYGETQVTRKTFVTNKTVKVIPTGQGNGFQGDIPGEDPTYITFSKTGGSNTTFTVTIDAKAFSFTAETGKYTQYGVSYSAALEDGPNTLYKLQFNKYYTISSKLIDVYKYGEYQYSYYSHSPSYGIGHQWLPVGTIN